MKIKTALLTALGLLLLGVGAVGIVVPILPTTPFVLLASACFAGNPKLRTWLYKSKFFAEHATNYRERTGLKQSTTIISLAFLWSVLVLSMVLTGKLWVTLLLAGVGAGVTVHIVWISRPKRGQRQEDSAQTDA